MSAEARVVTGKDEQTRAALARLEADGFLVRHEERWKTSRSWQRAMARAAAKLYEQGDAGEDLRVPIVHALLEAYAGTVEDEMLAELVEAMLPIEIASLGLAH